jgi:DNA-binding transcriptional LysR family regulator
MARIVVPSGISIERLQTFCAVVSEGSIASAAQSDPNRQSQFSRQIKELEQALGAKLFEKEGKSLKLTETGREFAVVALGFFNALDDLQAKTAGNDETVVIGAGESILRWLVIPRIPEVMTGPNAVHLEFRTCRTDEAVRCVQDGSLDLAIVRSDAVDDSFQSIPVGAIDYCLVVPRRRLPEKSAAAVSLMKEIPLALLRSEGMLARGVIELARKKEYPITVRAKADSFSLLIELMENTDLASVLPVPAADRLSKERFARVELPGIESLRRELRLIYQKRTYELREAVRRMVSRIPKLIIAGSS